MDDNCSSKKKNRDYFRKPLYSIKQGSYTSGFRGPLPSSLTKRKKKGEKKKTRKLALCGTWEMLDHPGYFLCIKVKAKTSLW